MKYKIHKKFVRFDHKRILKTNKQSFLKHFENTILIYKIKKYYLTLIILFVIIPLISVSQTNLMKKAEKDKSDLENMLCDNFDLAGFTVYHQLKNVSVEVGSSCVKGCKTNNKYIPLDQTIIGFKNNTNLIWIFYFGSITNKEGYLTDEVYAGYLKFEFGEKSDEYLIKIRKKRIYPQNNIFTESITFDNGIAFFIEDKRFIKHINLLDGTLEIDKYYYEDCPQE